MLKSPLIQRATVPSCRCWHNAAQLIASGVVTPLAFNQEHWDNDSLHNPAVLNTRITVRTPGKYSVGATFTWAAGLAGTRQAGIRLNGGWVPDLLGAQLFYVPAATGARINVSILWNAVAGDFFDVIAYQVTGVGLNVNAGPGADSPGLWAHWLSPWTG